MLPAMALAAMALSVATIAFKIERGRAQPQPPREAQTQPTQPAIVDRTAPTAAPVALGAPTTELQDFFAAQRAQKLDLSGVAILEPQLSLLPMSRPRSPWRSRQR